MEVVKMGFEGGRRKARKSDETLVASDEDMDE